MPFERVGWRLTFGRGEELLSYVLFTVLLPEDEFCLLTTGRVAVGRETVEWVVVGLR